MGRQTSSRTLQQWLYAFATTPARARAIFGIDESVEMLHRDLGLTDRQRAEFGNHAKLYAVDALDLAQHWTAKNMPAKWAADDAALAEFSATVIDALEQAAAEDAGDTLAESI